MGQVRLRVVQFDGEIESAAFGKLLDAVFPNPHPLVENVRAVGAGLKDMMESVARAVNENEPFKLHVENKPRKTTPTPPNKGGRKPGSTNKPKPATPPAKVATAGEPVKS